MSRMKWILLGIIFTLYLLFGGSIFMVLEQKFELHQQAQLSVLRKDIQEILLQLDRDFYCNGTPTEVIDAIRAAKEGVLARISDICGGNDLLNEDSTDDLIIRWTFYNSLFFAFTAITTIGYGNLTPATQYSRIFTIFYALIGIPINGILLTNISDLFSSKLVKAHQRSKENESKVTFIFNIIFYLIPGLLVFVIAPAGFFVMIENWTFLDAIYFCFVSLTTIGFGDYVAGMGDGHNIWLWAYKVVIIVWIVFGLGYFVMILGYITKGITSKRVRSVIEKRLYGIRLNKEKLSKEIDYMRKVVDELYILKTKSKLNENVNHDFIENESLNEFVFGCNKFPIRRIKSFNDFLQMKNTEENIDYSLIRSFSESDLDRLGKPISTRLEQSKNQLQNSMNELFSSIMESVRGNITNVLEAVNELNAYEDGTGESGELAPAEGSRRDEQDLENRPVSTWDSGQFTESDEEILLDSDAEGAEHKLKEVVVHGSSTKTNILDKMSDVFRKISTATKMSSEPGSRKVSRIEEKRNPGNNQRKISQEQQMCVSTIPKGSAGLETSGRKEPSTIKSSRSSLQHKRPNRVSRQASHKALEKENIYKNEPMHTHEQKSTISHSSSLDSIVLTQFLEALNSAEDHLHHNSGDASSAGGIDNFGYLGPNETTPKESRRRGPRRRKVGIFNPEFKYFSHDISSSIELKKRKDLSPNNTVTIYK